MIVRLFALHLIIVIGSEAWVLSLELFKLANDVLQASTNIEPRSISVIIHRPTGKENDNRTKIAMCLEYDMSWRDYAVAYVYLIFVVSLHFLTATYAKEMYVQPWCKYFILM